MVQSPDNLVRHCAHLLTHEHQTERPDGLPITNDNLVEPCTAGLAATSPPLQDVLHLLSEPQ